MDSDDGGAGHDGCFDYGAGFAYSRGSRPDYSTGAYCVYGANQGNMPIGVYVGVDDGSGSFVCSFCGGRDYSLVVFDDVSCKFVAGCCGIATDDDPVPPSCYGNATANRMDLPSCGYDRITHVHELIRQDMRMEPRISNAHRDLIAAAYAKTTFAPGTAPKRRVQEVLRSLNREHNTTSFTKCYLEKWKTIIYENEGYMPAFDLTDEERALWSVEMAEFSRVFDDLRSKGDPGLKGRKHVPNLRILARRIFDLHGIQYDPEAFPVPDTVACVKKNNEIINYVWSKMPNKTLLL